MAVTRADVVIPAKTWVNLYAASGIAVGTAAGVYNKGSNVANLAISVAAPASVTIGIPIYIGPDPTSYRAISASEVGLWAYSIIGTTLLVQES